MKMEIILIRVGIPDVNGNVYSSEALQALAAAEPEKFRIDNEGNLRRLFTDEETAEMEVTDNLTAVENEALNKFADVLKERLKQGTYTGPQPLKKESSWIPLVLLSEDDEGLN